MYHFCTPLKTSENLWFSYVFRGYRTGQMVGYGFGTKMDIEFSKLFNEDVIKMIAFSSYFR